MKTRHFLLVTIALSFVFSTSRADATAIKGTVVRYDPGHSISIIKPDGLSATFTLAPNAEVTGDIAEGRVVYLVLESESPSAQITKISMSGETPPGISNAYIGGVSTGAVVAGGAAAPAAGGAAAVNNPGSGAAAAPPGAGTGEVATGTAVTLPPREAQTTAQTTTSTRQVRVLTNVGGIVQSYTPGRSLTIRRGNGTVTTYRLNGESQLPDDLAVGRRVTVRPARVGGETIAQQVTVTRRTRSQAAITNR